VEAVNHRIRGTHRFAEEGLEVERRAGGSRLAGERVRRNGMEAGCGDESCPLRIGRTP